MENIRSAFEQGFSSVLHALSRITSGDVQFRILHFRAHVMDKGTFPGLPVLDSKEDGVLLTTQITGDIVGRNYLFLSGYELEKLSAGDRGVTREAFIKELHNVLSSSVLSTFCNKFGIRAVNGPPAFVRSFNAKPEDMIVQDFTTAADEIYVAVTSFFLKANPWFAPLFVWVIDKESLHIFSEKRMAG